MRMADICIVKAIFPVVELLVLCYASLAALNAQCRDLGERRDGLFRVTALSQQKGLFTVGRSLTKKLSFHLNVSV